MKKILSTVLAIAMLLSCMVITVSGTESVTDPNLYEPRDFTLTDAATTESNMAILAWKNPSSSTLEKVTVKCLSSGDVQTVSEPVANSVSSVKMSVGADYGVLNFEVTFDFTGGKKTQVYYADRFNGGSSDANLFTASGVTYDTTYGGDNTTKRSAEFDILTEDGVNHGDGGKRALKITSNITEGQGRVFFSGASLTAATKYNYSFWVYAPNGDATFKIVDNNNYTAIGTHTVNKSSEWQKIEGSGTIGNNNSTIRLTMDSSAEAFYIDDVSIIKDGEISGWTMDFETDVKTSSEYSSPTTFTASGGDQSATLSWSGHNGAATRYINVYDVTNGQRVLRAKTDHNATGVELKYLENGKTYTFEVEGQALCGHRATTTKTVTVTPVKDASGIYKYEPADIMVTDWRKDKTYEGYAGYSMLSWKNPTSDTLSSVKIYRIVDNDGIETETEVTSSAKAQHAKESKYCDIATPGAIGRLWEGQSSADGTVKYRLVFTFSDGSVRDIVFTDSYARNDGVTLVESESNKIGACQYNFMSYGPYETSGKNYASMGSVGRMYISSAKKNGGKASLQIAGNSWAMNTDNNGTKWVSMGNDYVNYEQALNLTAGGTYKLKMMINTTAACKLQTNGSTTFNIPNTNGMWQEFSSDFVTKADKFDIRTLGAEGGIRSVYIDDLEIYTSDDQLVYSEDFERSAIGTLKSAPAGLSVKGGNGEATISWTSADYGYVNVYEVVDDTEVLRARVQTSDNSVTIKNLTNDVEHDFVVKTSRGNRETYPHFEGEAGELSVTPTAPDYEISDVKLLSDGNAVSNIAKGGNYTASAKVVNNKVTGGVKAQVIVAVYNGNKLENVYLSNAETTALGGTNTLTANAISIGNDANADYTAKIMVWKGVDSATPLVKSYTYTLATE